VDLQRKSDEELVELSINRGTGPRATPGHFAGTGCQNSSLRKKVYDGLPDESSVSDPKRKLRWLWTLHVTGGSLTQYALRRANEFVRAWAIKLPARTGTSRPTS